MANNGESGMGCFVVAALVVIVVIYANFGKIVSAYIKALNGPYGGLWFIPLLIIGVIIYLYIKHKDEW